MISFVVYSLVLLFILYCFFYWRYYSVAYRKYYQKHSCYKRRRISCKNAIDTYNKFFDRWKNGEEDLAEKLDSLKTDTMVLKKDKIKLLKEANDFFSDHLRFFKIKTLKNTLKFIFDSGFRHELSFDDSIMADISENQEEKEEDVKETGDADNSTKLRSQDRADEIKTDPPTKEKTTELVEQVQVDESSLINGEDDAVLQVMVVSREKMAEEAIGAEKKVAKAINMRDKNADAAIATEEKVAKAIQLRNDNGENLKMIIKKEDTLFELRMKNMEKRHKEVLDFFRDDNDAEEDGKNGRGVAHILKRKDISLITYQEQPA